jgi:hypothetical protein
MLEESLPWSSHADARRIINHISERREKTARKRIGLARRLLGSCPSSLRSALPIMLGESLPWSSQADDKIKTKRWQFNMWC